LLLRLLSSFRSLLFPYSCFYRCSLCLFTCYILVLASVPTFSLSLCFCYSLLTYSPRSLTTGGSLLLPSSSINPCRRLVYWSPPLYRPPSCCFHPCFIVVEFVSLSLLYGSCVVSPLSVGFSVGLFFHTLLICCPSPMQVSPILLCLSFFPRL